MEQSGEAASYVRQLEEQYDANQPEPPAFEPADTESAELPASEDLIDDLERFLRERRNGDE